MAAPYQLAWDGFEGRAYSGVIKSDGTWVPCAADNDDWAEYEEWLGEDKDPPNRPDAWRSPDEGGVVLKLAKDQIAIGSMLHSLAPARHPSPPAAQHQSVPPAPRTQERK